MLGGLSLKTSRAQDEEVRCEILQYLLQNPQGADTVEGITEWWLLQQRIIEAVSMVEGALRELVERRLVTAKTINGRVLYQLNVTKRGEAKKYLDERRNQTTRQRSRDE
jgi:hypothetical protein